MTVNPRVQAKTPLFARRSRREIIAGAAAMALTPTVARAADPLRVGKAIASSFPFAGLELGKEQGFFLAAGLDATITTFRGDGQMQQAFAAGALPGLDQDTAIELSAALRTNGFVNAA